MSRAHLSIAGVGWGWEGTSSLRRRLNSLALPGTFHLAKAPLINLQMRPWVTGTLRVSPRGSWAASPPGAKAVETLGSVFLTKGGWALPQHLWQACAPLPGSNPVCPQRWEWLDRVLLSLPISPEDLGLVMGPGGPPSGGLGGGREAAWAPIWGPGGGCGVWGRIPPRPLPALGGPKTLAFAALTTPPQSQPLPPLATLSVPLPLLSPKEKVCHWTQSHLPRVKVSHLRIFNHASGRTNCFCFCFCFLRPHPRHMDVPRLGTESELQLSAPPEPQQCRILNPLNEARDRT